MSVLWWNSSVTQSQNTNTGTEIHAACDRYQMLFVINIEINWECHKDQCYIVRYCLTAAALVTDSLTGYREHSGVLVCVCVCAFISLLFQVWFSFSDVCFISDSFFHISYLFFSQFIVIHVLVWQLDNSLSAFFPVSGPLSIARYFKILPSIYVSWIQAAWSHLLLRLFQRLCKVSGKQNKQTKKRTKAFDLKLRMLPTF